MSSASNPLQEKEHAGLVFLPCTDRRETPSRYATLEYNNFELVLFFCVYVCFCF